MVSEHCMLIYYYLKTFEIKFQSTKALSYPVKSHIVKQTFLKFVCLRYCENLCDFVKLVFIICMLEIVCLFYVFYSLSA